MAFKLSSNLFKGVNGLFLFAISMMLMIDSIHWLIGLFLFFGAGALCVGAWFDNKNIKLAAIACLYFLFSIVFFVEQGIACNPYFIGLWVMLEGLALAFAGLKMKEDKAKLWFIVPAIGATAIMLAFIGCFLGVDWTWGGNVTMIVPGLAMLFASLGNQYLCATEFLPKLAGK